MGWHLGDLPSLLVKAPGPAFPQRRRLQWALGAGEEGGRGWILDGLSGLPVARL